MDIKEIEYFILGMVAQMIIIILIEELILKKNSN